MLNREQESNEAVKMLSVSQAAEELGVSKRRVQQFISERRLPAVKIGNYYGIEKSAIDRFAKVKRKSGAAGHSSKNN